MRVSWLLLLLIGAAANTSGQGFSVKGRVTDTQGQPLPGATVVLGELAYTASCNTGGLFSLENIEKGSYLLRVSYIGFTSYTDSLIVDRNLAGILVKLSPRPELLQEVVVEGSHSEMQRTENPLSVEVVTSEFIRQNLGGSLSQSLDRLPGIGAIEIGSGQSKPVIRGLSFNRVVVVENGIKHQSQQWGVEHGLEIDQYAVDRLDVIKGPASLAYGSDAIGGVIDIRKDVVPGKGQMGGSVILNYKTNNLSPGGSVNLYGRTDKLFFDTRFTFMDYADFRVPAGHVSVYSYKIPLKDQRLRNTAGEEAAFHFSSGYIDDSFSSILYFSYISSQSGFFANAHGLEPRSVDTAMHDRSHRDLLKPYHSVEHFKISNRTLKIVNGHKIEMEAGFQRNLRSEWSDYVNHGYMPADYPDAMPIPQDLERNFDKPVVTFNMHDEFVAGRHTFSGGINTEYQVNRIDGWGFIIPAFRQMTAGLFLSDKLRVNDLLFLHGGVRYDFGGLRIEEYSDWFTTPVPGANDTSDLYLVRADQFSRSFGSLSWAFGLNYNPGIFHLKVNLGKSFRMPQAHELSSNGVNYHYFSYHKGNPGLSPEESYQADISIELNRRGWAVQFSPFLNYFTNYIYLNPTPEYDYLYGAGNQVFEYTQSEVVRFGGEIHAHVRLYKSLKAGLIAEYIYSEQLSGDKEGFSLPFSPPPALLLNLTYAPVIKSRHLSSTYFLVDLNLAGPQDRIVPPEKKTGGYQVLNLAAGTKLKMKGQVVEVHLQVRNLFDTKYFNHTSFYRLIDVPEPGRDLIISVKVPFNIISKKQ